MVELILPRRWHAGQKYVPGHGALREPSDGHVSRCFLAANDSTWANFLWSGWSWFKYRYEALIYASLWLRTPPFPHPCSLASSYRYLISCVDFCLAFLSAQCSSHTAPAAAGWNSTGRGEEAGACWNLHTILLPGRQEFTGGRPKHCLTVRVKMPFSGVAGCVDKP